MICLKEELSIDFTKQTLLICKKIISQIREELEAENVVHTDDINYMYRTVVKNGSYTALRLFLFGVIIPKISDNTKIKFGCKNPEAIKKIIKPQINMKSSRTRTKQRVMIIVAKIFQFGFGTGYPGKTKTKSN